MANLEGRGGLELRPGAKSRAAVGGPVELSAAPSAAATFPVLLNDEQSAASLGVSVRKFHELRDEPWMPRPVVLGPRLLRWPRAEIESAVANMPRQQAKASEPAQLLRSRIDRAKRSGSLDSGAA